MQPVPIDNRVKMKENKLTVSKKLWNISCSWCPCKGYQKSGKETR